MSFKKEFFKNILVSAGYSYSNQLIIFLASIITSRLLLPENYGLVGLITVFSGFISIFLDSGVSLGVIRSNYGRTFHNALHNLALIIGVILCAATVVVIFPASYFYKNSAIILPGVVLSFLFVIRSLSLVPNALLIKNMKFTYKGRMEIYSSLAGIIVTIVLAYLKYEHWALVWGQYASALILLYLSNRETRLKLWSSKFSAIKKSFQISKSLMGSLIGFNIINYWARNADNLLVGKFYGPSELGIYNRAYTMLTLPINLITGIFSNVLLPSMVKLKKNGGNVSVEYFFVLKIISVINIPVALILIIFPDYLVSFLWGEHWLQVAGLLPYFGVLIMTQTLLSTVGNILVLEGKEKVLMYSGWASAAFVLIGIAIGVSISLEAVAAFYALAFIVGSLSFNVFFVYYKTLQYSSSWVIWFWMPKIAISILIWVGIYIDNDVIKSIGLVIWVILILTDVSKDAIKVYSLFTNRGDKNT